MRQGKGFRTALADIVLAFVWFLLLADGATISFQLAALSGRWVALALPSSLLWVVSVVYVAFRSQAERSAWSLAMASGLTWAMAGFDASVGKDLEEWPPRIATLFASMLLTLPGCIMIVGSATLLGTFLRRFAQVRVARAS